MKIILKALLDTAIMVIAFAAAFALRFDFREPSWGWFGAWTSFAIVWAVQMAALWSFDCLYRWRLHSRDILRFVVMFASSVVLLTFIRGVLYSPLQLVIRPPFTITIVNGFLWAVGALGMRWLWTLYTKAVRQELRLLNRRERAVAGEAVRDYFSGKRVMVTGAGGSIGSEIVRQVLEAGANKVLMVERGEHALYEICEEVLPSEQAVPLMLDINETEKIAAAMAKWEPQIVLHAAAYKHLPMCEVNEEEAWRNNAQATEGLVAAARANGVENFVLISTDKAVNPTSVMGKTKRAAEKATLLKGYTAVRFGNVLGSSGSVVPKWERQIANGGPVTVTDRRMTRYFMTVQEAVGLVLVAATMESGHIYTLDMGKPVSMVALAEEMILREGYRPYHDIAIKFTGIRSGEKLHEELGLESARATAHAKIYMSEA